MTDNQRIYRYPLARFETDTIIAAVGTRLRAISPLNL